MKRKKHFLFIAALLFVIAFSVGVAASDYNITQVQPLDYPLMPHPNCGDSSVEDYIYMPTFSCVIEFFEAPGYIDIFNRILIGSLDNRKGQGTAELKASISNAIVLTSTFVYGGEYGYVAGSYKTEEIITAEQANSWTVLVPPGKIGLIFIEPKYDIKWFVVALYQNDGHEWSPIPWTYSLSNVVIVELWEVAGYRFVDELLDEHPI